MAGDPERYKVGETTFDPKYDGLNKLSILGATGTFSDSADDTASQCTYVIGNEDHTLGNSLRYAIMKDPRTEFCGYSIPHPSERKIHLRVQTKDGTPCNEVLRTGLETIKAMGNHMLKTFESRVVEHREADTAMTE
eukprot:m.108058 g.108058  ORF g.108058 m.108058 type:complete len:136 (+) comp10644_c0_seq4:2213-2620(+)